MTIPWILLVLGLVAIAVVWLLKVGMQPVMHRPLRDELVYALLDALLYRGIEKTTLEFASTDGAHKMRFSKYTRPAAGIAARLTVDSRTSQEWQDLIDELTRRGIDFRQLGKGKDASATLYLDFGTDLGLANFVIKIAFERAFSLSLERDCVAHYEYLLPKEVPHLTGISRA